MRVLNYVNAGHDPTLIVRQASDGVRLIRLESKGLPIGTFPDATYQGRSCLLQPGDLLVAYTDGVTESSNTMQEFWGLARLEGILSTCVGKRPGEIIEAILSARETFAGTIAPTDDMTLVVAKIEQTAGSRLVKSPQDHETAATCRDAVEAAENR